LFKTIDILKIYKVYTEVYALRDIHRLPIYFKKHAALMLIKRFRLSLDEVRHFIKVARVIKPLEKDGTCGILQSDIGSTKIRFVCMVRDNALWIITVEECR
jgi:hypothetical protein